MTGQTPTGCEPAVHASRTRSGQRAAPVVLDETAATTVVVARPGAAMVSSRTGRRDRAATISTPARRRRGGATIGAVRLAQQEMMRVNGDRHAETMTGVDRLVGVTSAVPTNGANAAARDGVTTSGGRRVPVPAIDVTGRLVRHAVVHDQVGQTGGRPARHEARDRDRDRAGRVSIHDMSIQPMEQEVAVSDRRMTIAIDGPAAAGKSTVGEIVAQRIDGIYFDTGVLYRALTLLALEHGVKPDDAASLATLAATMDICIDRPSVDDGRQVDVLLAGRDLSNSLRTSAIDQNVSAVSAHALVRAALLEHQRRIARSGRVVMVGRDIGTVVLPDADLKIFLDASPEERARRRCMQLVEMGKPQPYEDVLADMKRRDRIDSERDVAPLRPASDAIVVDSDPLTIEQVADLIVEHAEARMQAVCE